jgi:hypothetical protein
VSDYEDEQEIKRLGDEVERLTRALDLQLSRAWRLERICGRVDMLILRLTAGELATDTASLVGEIREARATLGEVPAVG